MTISICQNDCHERGYVVLAILVMLIGAGSAWISATSGSIQSATGRYASTVERQGLVDARQSLLSYAAMYARLYGPSGAGPGHLPCPDTDGFNLNSPLVAQGNDQRRDGANPPCAALVESAGLLPRHTKLPDYQYLFHAEPWQKYQYVVSGDMVNNPLNRLVNLERLADRQKNTMALVSLNTYGKELSASTPVTTRALVRAVSASVAGWVVSRGRTYPSRLCLHTADAQQPAVSEDPGDGACIRASADAQLCPFDILLSLLVDALDDTVEGCLADNLATLSIEGTPALRHWFVRNSWFESFVVSGTEECVWNHIVDGRCELVITAPDKLSVLLESRRIELQWRARS